MYINKVNIVLCVVNKVQYIINKVYIVLFYSISNQVTCNSLFESKMGREKITSERIKTQNDR